MLCIKNALALLIYSLVYCSLSVLFELVTHFCFIFYVFCEHPLKYHYIFPCTAFHVDTIKKMVCLAKASSISQYFWDLLINIDVNIRPALPNIVFSVNTLLLSTKQNIRKLQDEVILFNLQWNLYRNWCGGCQSGT